MSNKEAFEALGLNIDNYIKNDISDKELKKIYRTLSKNYHPDLHFGSKEAEEKTKLINEAYEFLNKLKEKTGSYVGNKKPISLKDFVLIYKNKLEAIISNSKIEDKEYPVYYDEAIKKIKDIIGTFDKNYHTKGEAFNEYKAIKKKIIVIFKELRNNYCEENGISLAKVKNNLDLNVSIRVLYEQLELMKMHYSYKNGLKEALDKIMYSYQDKKGYSEIKHLILKEKDKLIKAYKETDIEELFVIKFNSIIAKLFNYYFLFKPRLDSLEKFIKEHEDISTIKENFDNLVLKFKAGTLTEKDILESECIKSYYEKLENEAKRKELSKSILENIMNNFNNAVNVYTGKVDTNSISIATVILKEAVLGIEKFKREQIGEKAVSLLNKIDFKNFKTDILLLNSALNNAQNLPEDNIFINKEKLGFFDVLFNTLEVIDGKFYMIGKENFGEAKTQKEVSIEDILNNYIGIDVYLDNALFDGNFYKDGNGRTTVLYKWNGKGLVITNTNNITFKSLKGLLFPIEEKDAQVFKDKEYLKNYIRKNMDLNDITLTRKNRSM